MSIKNDGHYRMKHRARNIEALRLHFEEHLPRIVAGHRLGVPKSTGCSMFMLFRRAGLSWPLPVGMSEQEFEHLPTSPWKPCSVLVNCMPSRLMSREYSGEQRLAARKASLRYILHEKYDV